MSEPSRSPRFWFSSGTSCSAAVYVYALLIMTLAFTDYSESPSELCSQAASDPLVVLDYCGLTSISRDDVKHAVNATSFYLQHNYLQELEPYLFWDNKHLSKVYLANNPNLVVPENETFLCSETIRYLNLSNNGICVVRPSAFACMTKLSHVVMTGNPGCEESRRLAKEERAPYKVLCGGSTPSDDVSGPNSTLCSKARRRHQSTPQPDRPDTSTERDAKAPENTDAAGEPKHRGDAPHEHPTATPNLTWLWIFLGLLFFVVVVVVLIMARFWSDVKECACLKGRSGERKRNNLV